MVQVRAGGTGRLEGFGFLRNPSLMNSQKVPQAVTTASAFAGVNSGGSPEAPKKTGFRPPPE
jgi:hypothetical protein